MGTVMRRWLTVWWGCVRSQHEQIGNEITVFGLAKLSRPRACRLRISVPPAVSSPLHRRHNNVGDFGGWSNLKEIRVTISILWYNMVYLCPRARPRRTDRECSQCLEWSSNSSNEIRRQYFPPTPSAGYSMVIASPHGDDRWWFDTMLSDGRIRRVCTWKINEIKIKFRHTTAAAAATMLDWPSLI